MPTMAPPNPNTQTAPNPNNPGDPNQQPSPNQEKLDDIRIVLTSLDSNVDSFAREAAHNKLADERKKGPLWKRMTRGVWHTMMREHVVVQATNEARDEILENDNLRHHKGESDAKWREDTVRRYSSEYAEHLIHDEAGETFHKFDKAEADTKGNEHVKQMRDEALDLVRQFARGNIASKSDLEAMQDRMFEAWREDGIGQDYIDKGQFLAHNITDMAEQVKAALAARQGLNDIDRDRLLDEAIENAEFVTGEAKVGSRTEIEATRSERLAKKLQNVPFINEGRLSKIGAVLGNEMVISSMLSVAFAIGQRGASSAASTLVPGLGAGIIAGIRERRAMRDERALMDRRRDNGEQVDTKNKAQAELDATLYESRPAGELLDELSALYDQNGDLTLRDRSGLDAALKLQGEIRARIQLNDRDGARLINFADISADEMEARRFDLDLAAAKLETDMKKLFTNPVAGGMLGIQQGETYDDLLGAERDTMIGLLKGEMTAQDRLFNKLVLKRALKRSLITALTATGIGAVGRYAHDALGSLLGELFGGDADIEMVLAGNETDTIGGTAPDVTGPIGGVAPEVTGPIGEAPTITGPIGGEAPDVTGPIGGKAPEVTGPIGTEVFKGGDTIVLGDKTKVVLPEGFRIEAHGNDVKLTMPNGTTIESTLEKNGQLSQNALDVLKNQGLNVIHHEEVVQGEQKVTHAKVNAREFVENHKNDMVEIDHEKWYTQNTRKYDLNELGAQNKKLDNGNIRISIKGMTAGGSFVGDSGVNWHEAAKEGQLMAYLSASPGTQSRAFEIPIGPDGMVDIDENSPAGALFNKEGKFIGGYQEIAIKGNTNPNGATKIATLATVVGTQQPEINDVIVTPTTATAHTYTIVPPPETMANAATFTKEDDIFTPVVPVYARRKLGESEPAPVAMPNTNTPPSMNLGGNSQNPTNPNGNPTNPNNQTAPGSAQGSPNNANQAGGNTQTNPNNAGNFSNGSANPNANQQKKTNSQANGGRPTGTEWQKFAREQTGSTFTRNQQNGGQNRTYNNQNGNPNYQYAATYTKEENEILKRLTDDPRGMPDTFKSLPWNPNMTPTAHKIMAVVLHGLIDASNRQPGETEGAWRIRVITACRMYAERGLGALGQALPGVRPFMQEAFDSFLAATEPTAAPNSNPNSNANASSTAGASAP